MAEHSELYIRAHYYDVVFRRDVLSEVAFLCALYEQRNGRAPASLIDIACGPGYHAKAFAALGRPAVALDIRPEMVAFAADGAAGTVTYLAADMRNFTLAEPVDLALTSFDSIDCLRDQDDVVAHFRAVAQNLTPGGLYVLELTHPRDCSMWDYGTFRYRGERDGVRVEIDWAVNEPRADLRTQIVETEVVMRVDDRGTGLTFTDRATERFFTVQELQALARLSGALTLTATFGDFRLDQPFDHSDGARRMIIVLAKQGIA